MHIYFRLTFKLITGLHMLKNIVWKLSATDKIKTAT